MRRRITLTGTALLIAAIVGAQVMAVHAKRARGEVKFKVRIENISSADGQLAADGTRWPFALSPGMWVIDRKENLLFEVGKKTRANGLEPQAEEGNPESLVKTLAGWRHDVAQHGVFNTPVGAMGPGPAGPGAAYEFTFGATPGMKLSLITMFGQSNDLFYAPAKAIPLFDSQDRPVSGDITSQVRLWDAGTEINQEPGVGPDQAPRQKMPNTGAAESGTIGPVKDQFTYPQTEQVLRITITPESES